MSNDRLSAFENWTDPRYTLLEPIGQGSFGVVWKARREATGQLVALKVARTCGGNEDPDVRQCLADEIRVTATLSHPHIPALVDSGPCPDGYYAAFDFVPGITLRDALRTESQLAPSEATRLMRQVLDALRHAHDRGVVHRDVKPENVLLACEGETRKAFVLDFGLASLVAHGSFEPATLSGTAAYAAPEQLRGEKPAPSADLYAWGLTFLECLTGEAPPLARPARESALARLGSASVAIPSWLLHQPLGRLLEIVTTKDPVRRARQLPRVVELLAAVENAAVDATRAPRRTPSPSATADTRDTPLAGRGAELHRLTAAWNDIAVERRHAFVIVGEGGIGKSRLVHELRGTCAGGKWMELRCAPENRTSPLQPVVDAFFAMDTPLEILLDRYELDRASYAPLFIDLLRLPPDERHPPLNVTPDRQKELTLRAIVLLVQRLARQRPFTLVIENLHWADATTLELVKRIVQESEESFLIVCTTRPEGVPTWAAAATELMVLQRLTDAEVEAMVRSATPASEVDAAAIARIVARAEGIPLFAEELARLVTDSPDAIPPDPPAWEASAEVPSGLHAFLTARLDTVSLGARETAELAATLGREFGYDLLAEASPDDRGRVDAHLDELARAGLVRRQGDSRGPTCTFRHALLRDAVYNTTAPTARRRLHRDVAVTLRELFPEHAARRPEILASHYEHGGELGFALAEWLRAANDSYRRAAYAESFAQSEHALELAGTEPDRRFRSSVVDLLVTKGTALFSLQSWAAPEVEETFGQAWHLATEPGNELPPQVLYGVWGVHIVRSNPTDVRGLLPHLERFAARTDDDVACHMGESCLGIAAYWRGDFPTALRHLRRAIARYGPAQGEASYDNGIYSYAFGFCAAWTSGRFGEAFRLRDEAFAIAERRADPYSRAVVLAFGGMMAHDCGEIALARDWSCQLMQLADEQQLYPYWAPGAVSYGRALVAAGEIEPGLDAIRAGLERYRLLGILASFSYYHCYLADGLLAAGRDAEAASTIAEGFTLCRTLYARFHEPELIRLRGRLERRRAELEDAAASFHEALAMAESDGSLAFQLRAATDLADLEGSGPNAALCRERLAALCARIGTDVETGDLRAARALL